MDIINAIKREKEVVTAYIRESTRIQNEVAEKVLQVLGRKDDKSLILVLCGVDQVMEKLLERKKRTDTQYLDAKDAYEKAKQQSINGSEISKDDPEIDKVLVELLKMR